MDRAGFSVSFATIGVYLRGDHGRPDDGTLQAFAAVFPELDIVDLRRLAAVPVGEGEPWVPPEEAHRLSRSQRAALNAVIAAMLEQPVSSRRHLQPASGAAAARTSSARRALQGEDDRSRVVGEESQDEEES